MRLAVGCPVKGRVGVLCQDLPNLQNLGHFEIVGHAAEGAGDRFPEVLTPPALAGNMASRRVETEWRIEAGSPEEGDFGAGQIQAVAMPFLPKTLVVVANVDQRDLWRIDEVGDNLTLSCFVDPDLLFATQFAWSHRNVARDDLERHYLELPLGRSFHAVQVLSGSLSGGSLADSSVLVNSLRSYYSFFMAKKTQKQSKAMLESLAGQMGVLATQVGELAEQNTYVIKYLTGGGLIEEMKRHFLTKEEFFTHEQKEDERYNRIMTGLTHFLLNPRG